jgi:hypothetical protein
MQDLFQNYVSDLNKLREAFHGELTAQAEELSKAMGLYSSRSEAALASFMEKVSTRGIEFEASAMARLNQFCGIPADAGLPDGNSGPVGPNADVSRVAAVAERAVAEGLQVESDGDRKPQAHRTITLVKSEPAA